MLTSRMRTRESSVLHGGTSGEQVEGAAELRGLEPIDRETGGLAEAAHRGAREELHVAALQSPEDPTRKRAHGQHGREAHDERAGGGQAPSADNDQNPPIRPYAQLKFQAKPRPRVSRQ